MSKLHYRIEGKASAPALFLMHGFLSSNHQWQLNYQQLAKHYRLFLIELWGHGHSPEPASDAGYSMQEYIDQIEALRSQYQLQTIALLGQSYSAGIVLHYAAQHANFCSGVWVTNSMSALAGTAVKRSAAKVALANTRQLPMHPVHSKRLPEPIKSKMINAADAVSSACVAQHMALAPQLKSVHLVQQLSCPLVLINGIYEKVFQPWAQALANQCQVINLPGGHSVNIDCPDQFNQILIP